MSTTRTAISPRRGENFPSWYQEVVRAADLASMSHVRGCMVIRPWGYGVWELMQRELDRMIKERGHDNVYFPLFIPLSYIQKEAEHVEGFAKEMAVVTHHRLEKRDGKLVPAAPLEEPLVVRPTSETIIGESMAEWVQSYRDLPLKLNQWANVVRWEMRPRVLLRTTEFLWQEGHTAHADEAEAVAETLEMHRVYESFAREWLAMPVVAGEKSPTERFPGAKQTFTIEAMMQDGKAVQAGTSHYLGQNFARSAGIEFTDVDGGRKHAYTTSWGASTRLVGALVMTHGDDDGLCVPPAVAPHQIVIVPMLRGEDVDTEVLDYAREIAADLRGKSTRFGPLRVHVDERGTRPSDKKWQWIKRGAPLLVEVGARDATASVVSYRNRFSPAQQLNKPFAEFVAGAAEELESLQDKLLAQAQQRLDENIRRDVLTRADAEVFFKQERAGFALAGWCGERDCETGLKALGVTIRCLPTHLTADAATCLPCGGASRHSVIWGLSY
ncbi:proline--tRNA ligase [Allokutzneria sp. NRRL B-24872]|uniref:proline--tRNA ligase n=1 Tax=Allokutzneria sp. NRRL B-24872 TaxID=1137961 RepID=UPI000A3D0FBC|nr:proline--tRNA ligase [Allokutzneria sp. NRRL B-24872]